MAKKIIYSVVVLALAFMLGVLAGKYVKPSFGSVSQSGEYHFVTKASGTTATTTVIQSGVSTLGSVILTSSTLGGLSILDWDGTTTTASTTIVTFADGALSGTYTFDVVAPNGLYYVASVTSTSQVVITYR